MESLFRLKCYLIAAFALKGSDFNAKRRKKYGGVFATNIAIAGSMVRVSGHEYVRQVRISTDAKTLIKF